MDGDYNDELLPGTVRLFVRLDDSGLGETAAVLVPQPTGSPDDPLNWSNARKYWATALLCSITALTAAVSNDAGSAANSQVATLGITWNDVNIAAGVLFIGVGYTTLLLAPTAALYGRKINYMICLVLSIIGSIWFARIQGTSDSIWNQLFVGASESCAEAAVQTSLSDLFFQHQRGTVLGLYVFATNVGTYMGPLIAGYIADGSMGWRWIGWWSVIISGAMFVVFFFGFEETSFDRKSMVNGFEPRPMPERALPLDVPSSEKLQGSQVGSAAVRAVEKNDTPAPTKSYWRRVVLITPSPNLKGWGFRQYGKRLWHTLRVFSFPAVIFAGLQWGAQDAWLTFYLTLEDDNWYDPPWNYTDAAVAIMNVPCIIGSIIGCIYGGYFSDVFVRWMAKRNGGIAEAEHRLWMMFPAALISPAGLLLFGIGTNNGWSWPVPYVGLGFIGFGWGCCGDLSMTYLVDAYPEMVMEGMVGVSVINNTMAVAFTFGTSYWLAVQSVSDVMITVGVLSFVFIMTSLPMMVYGKRCRQWTLPRYQKFIRLRDELD